MTTLNFDDVDTSAHGGYADVPAGYGGLNWTNMGVSNPALEDQNYNNYTAGSGYHTGLTSGSQDAYSRIGTVPTISSATNGTFSLNSIEMTSAWNTKERVDITAYDADGNLLYEKDVKLSDAGPKLVHFGWDNVSSVTFTPGKLTQDPNLPHFGDNIIFDDVKVAHVVSGSDADRLPSHGESYGAAAMMGSHEAWGHLAPGHGAVDWL